MSTRIHVSPVIANGDPDIDSEVVQIVREQREGARLRVTWVDNRVARRVAGLLQGGPASPLVGRTFFLEFFPSRTAIFDEDGHPCDEQDVCREALSDYSPDAAKEPAGVTSEKKWHRPIAVGGRVDDLAVRVLGGRTHSFRVSTARATLARIEGDTVAVFAASGSFSTEGASLQVDVEARFDIPTGRHLASSGNGIVTWEADAKSKKGAMRGPFAFEESVSFR